MMKFSMLLSVHIKMWPSATKWGSLRGLSKLRNVFHCNKHYFLYNLTQNWLLCDIPIRSYDCWTLPSTISFKTTLQRHGLSKIAIYVHFYGPIKNQTFHNTSFLSHFHIESISDYCAWYDKYFGRIYKKWKILILAHIFACNSKLIFPQRASFSHAGTHQYHQIIVSTRC